jgi:ATP-dependent Clp protease, protease subunit
MSRFNDDFDQEEEEIEEEESPQTEPQNKEPKKPLLERMLETRTITIFGEIDMKLAQEVTQKLLVLDEDSNDPIKIFINSPAATWSRATPSLT